MINPQKIYEFRNRVRELYKEESSGTEDLVSKILEIRDNNTNIIESINICLEKYSITVYFINNIDGETIGDIGDKIAEEIKKFIRSKIEEFSFDNKNEFYEFLDKGLFIDRMMTYSYLELNL